MSNESQPSAASAPSSGAAPQPGPHDFDVQKDAHRRIRNDPDYDDWEYGTEPLPHEAEAWVARRAAREAAEGGTAPP
jgi:hypothetical protein